jgi:sulfite exporter TauE/SafE
MLSDFLKLLTGGFVMGWGPCLAYSAPLLLPYIGGTKTSWKSGLIISSIFSLGRLLAIAILGGLASCAFKVINHFFPPQRSGYIYLIVAFIMVALGIFIVLGKGLKLPLSKTLKETILNRGTESMLALGFLMGIIPCVPHIAVLTYIACIAGNIGLGVLYAISFGIGTSFAPIALGSFMGLIPEKLIKSAKLLRGFQSFCGVILVVFGLQLIYYVFNIL